MQFQGIPLSIGHRRTKLVFTTFEELVAEGRSEIRPGDITQRLRERNLPLSYWEVRGELSNLEAEGLIEVRPETGGWQLAGQPVRKVG
jgi:hypothetical protein